MAIFTRGIAAGPLLTLLSYLVHAVDSVGSRITLAYLVGFFLALGPAVATPNAERAMPLRANADDRRG